MIVYDLNNRKHYWNLGKYKSNHLKDRPRSDLHIKARELLKSIFPMYTVLEEVPIPGLGMFFDFYIIEKLYSVEVQGQQHYKFSPFYFQHKYNWIKAQNRDLKKVEWCKINNITLVELPYDRKKQWRDIITAAC